MGGQSSIRPYWRCYYNNTKVIIYEADSTNTKRLEVRRHELHGLLDEDELKDAKLCVFAHAQDMDRALSKAEIASALHLPALKN